MRCSLVTSSQNRLCVRNTLLIGVVLMAVSWLLSIWFENIYADQLLYFGSVLAMWTVMLIVVVIDWRHHCSIWISLIQGFFLSTLSVFPIVRVKGGSDFGIIESAIYSVIIASLGGGIATIAVGLKARRIQIQHLLTGIRGWLILSAIGLVLSLIGGGVGIIIGLGSLKEMIDNDYGGYAVPSLLIKAGLFVYLIFVSLRFFKKLKNAPKSVTRLIIAHLAASVTLFIIWGLVSDWESNYPGESMLTRMFVFIITRGISAAIWIPYFKKSKRVQATFVN